MFYPAHLNLQNRKCLVVGGGTVAERKVVAMLISGGDVTVISPDATELITFLAEIGSIQWHNRQIKTGDTQGYFLVCAATDSSDINTAVYTEAHDTYKIRLVNVVDVIPQCTFAAASVVTNGELIISISTSGKSPATSRRIREHLEDMFNASSIYTLGYENGKPMPIVNQGLPYPVYLLLENRKCVILRSKKTAEINRRITLLRQCGANIVRHNSANIDNPFLVISDTDERPKWQTDCPDNILQEICETPQSGNFCTPDLVIDDNLIISISTRNESDMNTAKQVHKKLTDQFADNGFGEFIDLLGARRQEVLNTFQTSKARGDFFETLIKHVAESRKQTCCLSLTDPACSAECLFNWVRQGKNEYANNFISGLLNSHRPDI